MLLDNFVLKEIKSYDIESINRIGKLRYDVWVEEGALESSQFPQGCWTDSLDESGRHWIIETKDGDLAGAARLNFLPELDESSRDAALWKRSGQNVPLPTVDLGRLVVKSKYRRCGLAQMLNDVRVEEAKAMGAKSIIVTASAGNASLLTKIGFFDIGERIVFEDRPGVTFIAMQKNLC